MSKLALEVTGLTKTYGKKTVLNNLSFSVAANDFSVICGRPGNGKSVLVRTIMGLEKADSGKILVRGEDVTDHNPGTRNIGYIPQSFALFPNKNVRENIEYPLELLKVGGEEKASSVTRVAELLKIADLLEKNPTQLSGGQKQRVAIARGLAKATDVYVLDDPLVGLDFKLRERLMDDLRRTQEELGVAFIYVTSDPLEALALAKTAYVLSKGEIVQQGPLLEVYDQPKTVQAMSALGFPTPNFINGTVSDGTFTSDIFTAKVSAPSGEATIGIRPEGIIAGELPGAIQISADITLIENLGSENAVYLKAGNHSLVTVVTRFDKGGFSAIGSKSLTISIKPSAIQVFDAKTEKLIGAGHE